jgi:ABC-type transport system involved in cytochrome c biogenesis permease subunit
MLEQIRRQDDVRATELAGPPGLFVRLVATWLSSTFSRSSQRLTAHRPALAGITTNALPNAEQPCTSRTPPVTALSESIITLHLSWLTFFVLPTWTTATHTVMYTHAHSTVLILSCSAARRDTALGGTL